MKYIKPLYECENIEAGDIILASVVVELENGAALTEISKSKAKEKRK